MHDMIGGLVREGQVRLEVSHCVLFFFPPVLYGIYIQYIHALHCVRLSDMVETVETETRKFSVQSCIPCIPCVVSDPLVNTVRS